MDLHSAIEQLLQHFAFDHLPPHQRAVAQHFHWLAHALVGQAPLHDQSTHEQFALEGPELVVSLGKLLEARDAALRAPAPLCR